MNERIFSLGICVGAVLGCLAWLFWLWLEMPGCRGG